MLNSIGSRIMLVVLLSAAILLVFGVIGVSSIFSIVKSNEQLINLYRQNEIVQRIKGEIMLSNLDLVDILYNRAEDKISRFLSANEAIITLFDRFYTMAKTNAFIEDQSFAAENEPVIAEIRAVSLKAVDLYRANRTGNAISLYDNSLRKLSAKIIGFAEDSGYQRDILIDRTTASIGDSVRSTLIAIGIIAVIFILVNIAIGFVVKSSITKPLKIITATAGVIAAGNLNVVKISIKNKDELGFLTNVFNEMIDNLNKMSRIAFGIAEGKIGRRAAAERDGSGAGKPADDDIKGDIGSAFRTMIDNLTEIVTTMKTLSSNLNASVREIDTAMHEQTSAANEMASSITEVSATLQELSITAKMITDNVSLLVVSSEEIGAILEQNGKDLLGTLAHLEDVGRLSADNSAGMVELGKRSSIITQMVELIKDIANRTNILSINASIEASRAGEASSGFNVVAMEIREMSKETIASAKNVEHAANEVSDYLRAMVTSAESESAKVIESGALVRKICTSSEHVVAKIKSNLDFMQKIDASIKQQENGSRQAADTMKEMAAGSRQTADTARQTIVVTNDIVKNSSDLESVIRKFSTE